MKNETSASALPGDTKNRILDSSLALMRDRPFKKLKITDICAGAGVTTGAFYHYFSKKDDIIPELYGRLDQLFTSFYHKLQGSSYREKLFDYLLRHAKYAEHCGLWTCRNIYCEQLGPQYSFFGDSRRGFASHVLELVSAALASGEFVSEKSAEEIAESLIGIQRGAVYSWCLTDGALPVRTISRNLVGSYLDTLVPEGGEGEGGAV